MSVRALFGLWIVMVGLCGCERRNFDRCRNPDFPCEEGRFCKVAAGETIGTCVVAECAVSSDCPSSRPNCNSAGRCYACTTVNDCTRTADTMFCDAGRCVECRSPADCADPMKGVCDPQARVCRSCAKHYDCDSVSGAGDGVCTKDETLASLPNGQALRVGMCVPPGRVVVLENCSAGCSAQSKYNLLSPAQPYLRMKDAKISATLNVTPIPGLPEIHIVSQDGDFAPSDPAGFGRPLPGFFGSNLGPALSVQDGVKLTLEGVLVKDAPIGLECKPSPNGTRIRLIRSTMATNDTAIDSSDGCTLWIDQSFLGAAPRERYQGLTNSGSVKQLMTLDGTQFDFVNSVFHRNGSFGNFGGINIKTTSSSGRIVNCTFTEHAMADSATGVHILNCLTPNTDVVVVNSLLINSAAPETPKTYIHKNCKGPIVYVGTNDKSIAGTGNVLDLTLDSVFVSPIFGSDLSLKPTAPESVRAGGLTEYLDPQGKNLIPSVDINGKKRSSKVSWGAFQAD